jgi:hypothetical protein
MKNLNVAYKVQYPTRLKCAVHLSLVGYTSRYTLADISAFEMNGTKFKVSDVQNNNIFFVKIVLKMCLVFSFVYSNITIVRSLPEYSVLK